MNTLKTFENVHHIETTDIRTIIYKYFKIEDKVNRVFLKPENLNNVQNLLLGISSIADEIQIKHLVVQIELLKEKSSDMRCFYFNGIRGDKIKCSKLSQIKKLRELLLYTLNRINL